MKPQRFRSSAFVAKYQFLIARSPSDALAIHTAAFDELNVAYPKQSSRPLQAYTAKTWLREIVFGATARGWVLRTLGHVLRNPSAILDLGPDCRTYTNISAPAYASDSRESRFLNSVMEVFTDVRLREIE